MKPTRKLLAMVLALTLVLNMSGVMSLAAIDAPVCPNHVQHDESCGYSLEAVLPCTHTCDECAALDSSKPVPKPDPKPQIVIASFVALDTTDIHKPVGTAVSELSLPPMLDAVTPEGAAIKVTGVTWGSEPAYAPDTQGEYIFTAVLPGGYVLERPDIALPAITVTLGAAELVGTVPAATSNLYTTPSRSFRGINPTLPAAGFVSFASQLNANSVKIYDALLHSGMTVSVEIQFDVNLTYPKTTFSADIKKYLEGAHYRDFFDALAAIDRDHPEIFWLHNSQSVGANYSYAESGTNYICNSITLTFTPQQADYNVSQVGSVQSALKSKIDSILAAATAVGSTDYVKVKYFHDWLVNNNNYNPTVAAGSTLLTTKPWKLTSALLPDEKDGGPVCEGYARAFKALCDSEGIPCVLVSGTGAASAGTGAGAHMWNYVKLDDAWYPVDVTWDDPIVPGGGSYPKYDFFLIAGGSFSSTHTNNGNFSSGSGTFSYPALSTTSYDPATSSKPKPSGTPVPSSASLTYGDSLGTITLSGTFYYDSAAVLGTLTWQTPSQRLGRVGSYKAAWTFTPSDLSTYSTINGTLDIAVIPKPVTISISGANPVVYSGIAQGVTATYTPASGDTPKVNITYNGSAAKPVNAGDYSVVASIADSNYSATNTTATYKITPKPITLANPSLSIATGYTLAKKVSLSQFGIASNLFAKASISAITDSSTIFDGTPTIINGELSVKLKSGTALDQTATVQVTLTDSNYTVTPGILTVKVTKEGYHNTLLNAPKTVNLGEAIALPAGFAVKTEFDSGKPAQTTTVTNAMLSGYSKDATGAGSIGKKIITITVDGSRKVTFEINVLDVVSDLVVVAPAKLQYAWQTGTMLDLTGGLVTPVMRSTLPQVPAKMTVDMLNITDKTIGTVGVYPVNVTYRGKTKLRPFTITVDATGDIKTDPADLEQGKPGIAVVLPKDETYRLDVLQFMFESVPDSVQQEFAARLKDMSAFSSVEVHLRERLTGKRAYLPAGSKITILFPYPVGTSSSANSFKVLHKLDNGTFREEKFKCTGKGIEVTTDSLSPFAIAYNKRIYSGGDSGTSSDSGVASVDYDGYDFWMSVNEEIEGAKKGDTIKVDAKGYDKVPWNVMETLREKTNVTLKIKWLGENIVITSGKVLAYDGYIYYPLSLLVERYKGITADSGNPETGGVVEISAPKEAENLPVTPKNRGKDLSVDTVEKLDSVEEPAEPLLVAESTTSTMHKPASPVSAGLVGVLLLALVPILGGVWLLLNKKHMH